MADKEASRVTISAVTLQRTSWNVNFAAIGALKATMFSASATVARIHSSNDIEEEERLLFVKGGR